MARFSPQPEGTGPIFPISLSLVVRRHPVFVTPRSWNSKKLAPVAAAPLVLTGPNLFPVSIPKGPLHGAGHLVVSLTILSFRSLDPPHQLQKYSYRNAKHPTRQAFPPGKS